MGSRKQQALCVSMDLTSGQPYIVGWGERISEAEGTKYILTFTHRHMIKSQPVLAKSLLYAECSPWKERAILIDLTEICLILCQMKLEFD